MALLITESFIMDKLADFIRGQRDFRDGVPINLNGSKPYKDGYQFQEKMSEVLKENNYV